MDKFIDRFTDILYLLYMPLLSIMENLFFMIYGAVGATFMYKVKQTKGAEDGLANPYHYLPSFAITLNLHSSAAAFPCEASHVYWPFVFLTGIV